MFWIGAVLGAILFAIMALGGFILCGKAILVFYFNITRSLKWHLATGKKEQKEIAIEFEHAINNTVQRFSLGGRMVSDTFVKAEVVQKEDIDKLLGDHSKDMLIVKIPSNLDTDQALAKIAVDYSKSYFLRNEKPYIEIPLRDALDISFAKQILWYGNRRTNLSEVYHLYYGNNHIDNKWNDIISVLNEDLPFYYVALSEIIFHKDKHESETPNKKHHVEISEILHFINNLNEDIHTQQQTSIKPQFIDKRHNIGIIIFANPEKYKNIGISNHIYIIEKCIQMGLNRLYLIVGGQQTIPAAKALVRFYTDQDSYANFIFEKELEPFTHQKGYVACIIPKKEYTKKTRIDKEKELIIQTISQFVPEYNQGIYIIHSVFVDLDGKNAAVSFQTTNPDLYPDLSGAFGSHWSRFHEIKRALNLNHLQFSQYFPDEPQNSIIEAFKANADETDDIDSVEYDDYSQLYIVIVKTEVTYVKLIGVRGWRVRQAQYLMKAGIEVRKQES